MIEFEILARGPYRRDQFIIHYAPALTMPYIPAITRWIDEAWQANLAIAQAEGYPLSDFILYNHGNISATGEPNLLLYGAMKFGEGWYRDVREKLE